MAQGNCSLLIGKFAINRTRVLEFPIPADTTLTEPSTRTLFAGPTLPELFRTMEKVPLSATAVLTLGWPGSRPPASASLAARAAAPPPALAQPAAEATRAIASPFIRIVTCTLPIKLARATARGPVRADPALCCWSRKADGELYELAHTLSASHRRGEAGAGERLAHRFTEFHM